MGPAGLPPPTAHSRGDIWALRILGVILALGSLVLLLLGAAFIAFGASIWRDFGREGSEFWGSPIEPIVGGAVVAFIGIVVGCCAVLAFRGANGYASELPRASRTQSAETPKLPKRPPPPKHAVAWFVFDIALFVLLIVVLGLSARN